MNFTAYLQNFMELIVPQMTSLYDQEFLIYCQILFIQIYQIHMLSQFPKFSMYFLNILNQIDRIIKYMRPDRIYQQSRIFLKTL